jgi:hypothetical protein
MSDKPIPPIPPGVSLTDEQIELIAGGGCDLGTITTFINELKQNYDTLVDFTTYMMERVTGKQ